jgi:hypothetical protein
VDANESIDEHNNNFWNHMRTKLFFLLLVSLLISCSETHEFSPLTAAEIWKSQNIHNYTIEQIRSCFCPDGGEKMRITVVANKVVSVVRLSDSTVLTYPQSSYYLTVDSLFSIIQNSNSDSLVVAYDSKYGYPTKLDINPQLHPVDGGVMYTTTNLEFIR